MKQNYNRKKKKKNKCWATRNLNYKRKHTGIMLQKMRPCDLWHECQKPRPPVKVVNNI